MTSSSVALQASSLTVFREKTPVLSDLTFKLEAGQIVGLLGPSGSGKTTLMRAIVGVQTIEKGSLQVLGLPVGNRKLRSKIGYVTQSPSVYGDISIKQNLRYFGTLVGANNQQINTLLKQVQLYEIRSRLANDLSGGQRARLSLAIALLGAPEILVLDEPTVGLDPLLRRDLWNLFKNYAKEGVTLIVSSHVMDEADRCDYILLLREGRLLAQGDKKSILKNAREARTIESAFIRLVEDNKEEKR
ncbi:MAG: ABC transporter ATP-binding protein [Gammaproteobacteria bacterium]|nr:MAG: ABC transporter ATP-binding protein [Gammaproteobacteria bacterium]